ncbi:hypothetical protein [Flavobacterium sp. MDT1-60]|uniref:hypothetical protein n=1 Tax=Flavobacterium sp. MDT1-60 TaxID=1979344 RepID=UPI00177B9743|nr:hypothetical protein [Flavobacterium sp. MDT1-60]QOG04347.1 hypothetical protein IHE43_09110 [Flavobacterium sp. MDT1-60]
MSAQIVLHHYLDKFQTLANTLTDISFDNLSFLVEKEPIYNMKGQKIFKSYCDKEGREAIRISYNRIVGDYEFNGTTYENIFLGLQKTIHFLDWAGEIAYSKKKQFYNFDLQPVFSGDGTETIIGFSSRKQRQVLKNERYSADEYLQSMNPLIYKALYQNYKSEYEIYLITGISDSLVNAINVETNESILDFLDKEVYGFEPMTVKDFIILNLQ